MAEVTSGNVTVLVLNERESAALSEVLEHVAKYVGHPLGKKPTPKAAAVQVRKTIMAMGDLFEVLDAYGIAVRS